MPEDTTKEVTPIVVKSQRLKELRFYRANKDNKGFASKWQLSFKPENKYDPWIFFLVMAPQTGYDKNENGIFDWDNGIITKLGDLDIADMIAVLDGRKDSLGTKGILYHQTSKGNKIVKLDFVDGVFKLSVTDQDNNKNKVGPFYQSLNQTEGTLLSVLLKRVLERMYDW